MSGSQSDVNFECTSCKDRDVPPKYRVFGLCYKCAAGKSITKRNTQITRLKKIVANVRERDELIIKLIVKIRECSVIMETYSDYHNCGLLEDHSNNTKEVTVKDTKK